MRKDGEPKASSSIEAVEASENLSPDAWNRYPEYVKRFISEEPSWTQLCSEVAYTLASQAEKKSIKVASVTHRAKTLASFLEKIQRKSYSNPFDEITDFAGARVVCYYSDDLPLVEELIGKSFEILERDDKVAASGIDRFGYGGIHFLVRFGEHVSGARYDDLKHKVCEVQVRTVMQDAWAIVSHHLLYKRENDVPGALIRGVNALAGALDSADIAFQAIRSERDSYLTGVAESFSRNDLADVSLNLDSLRQYIIEKFPKLPYRNEKYPDKTERLVSQLQRFGYGDLSRLNALVDRTHEAREWFNANHPVTPDGPRDGLGEITRALYIAHPHSRKLVTDSEFKAAYDEANAQVKEEESKPS